MYDVTESNQTNNIIYETYLAISYSTVKKTVYFFLYKCVHLCIMCELYLYWTNSSKKKKRRKLLVWHFRIVPFGIITHSYLTIRADLRRRKTHRIRSPRPFIFLYLPYARMIAIFRFRADCFGNKRKEIHERARNERGSIARPLR